MALWEKITNRGNVEDRRSMAPVVGGIGITGIAILMLFNLLSGGDLTDVLSQLETIPAPQQTNLDGGSFEGVDEYELFASTVLGSNNEYWNSLAHKAQRTYSPPKLVLFRTAASSGCGTASSGYGPHYCPLDRTIYLDETFFEDLKGRFGAKGGDVAEAYVIAHEVGHHVQNVFGIMDYSQQAQELGSISANEASVNLELQADCFAGLWANSIESLNILEAGEIEEAMDAAAAVGDDRVQETVTGFSSPETWTHGSSEQRVSWFRKGFDSGEFASCDTFK